VVDTHPYLAGCTVSVRACREGEGTPTGFKSGLGYWLLSQLRTAMMLMDAMVAD
jgi:hypothetical protein